MTDRARKKRRIAALTLAKKLALRWCIDRRVDGLRVAVEPGDVHREAVFSKVEDALRLVKKYDRCRFNQLNRYLECVWVHTLSGEQGCFYAPLKTCELDTRFVLAETSSLEMIAATIVHEATHARLESCGIEYVEGMRHRIEAICLRQEIAFAAKLPNGQELQEAAEHILTLCTGPGFWSKTSMRERDLAGSLEALRYLGAPEWLLRVLVTGRRLRDFLSVR